MYVARYTGYSYSFNSFSKIIGPLHLPTLPLLYHLWDNVIHEYA